MKMAAAKFGKVAEHGADPVQSNEDRPTTGLGHPESSPLASVREVLAPSRAGLIVNADDWGRDVPTTERTLECALRGTVSSVSAMMFMQDSQRAAEVARERGVDAGLHLNLTSPFSAPGTPSRLIEHHQRVSRYLQRHRLAPAIFHPGLVASFRYVVQTQIDEFARLYGGAPERIDGHHHMHLCANVQLAKLLPAGTIVRRNFSFRRGEKSFPNRLYRRLVDARLARRHRLTDFLFSLPPLEPPARLQRIFADAQRSLVELETHPIAPEEYRFLMGGDILRSASGIWIAPSYLAPFQARTAGA